MDIVESKVLARIRSEVCDAVLVWLLACAVFALGIAMAQRPEFMPVRLLVASAVLVVVLAFLTLFRRNLPYVVRAGVIVVMGLLSGLLKLVLFGAPFGFVPLGATIIWGALFFGERAGIAVALTVFAALGAIYFGFSHGLIPPPGVSPPPLAASTWLMGAAVLAATTLGPLVAISRVGQRLDFERQQVEAISIAKSDFLATMGHELKTPLNAIMGFSEALGMGYAGPPDSARHREYIDHIHHSAQHLLTIVDDLLELARAEALQRKAVVEELEVAVELKKVISIVDVLSTTAGLKLQLQLDSDLPPMIADPKLFQQIMINLLSNAIKFTPAGGTVTVAGSIIAGCIRVEVSDTGIGIAADQLPELCQPFRQASHAQAHGPEGSGLGLALAKSFTELQGGKLSIRSEAGVGTRVAIDLPSAARSNRTVP